MTSKSGEGYGGTTTGTTGNIQQHWNSPIGNLQNTLKDSNFESYMLIGKDRSGKTQVYTSLSDNSESSELFTPEVQSVIQPESVS